MITTFAWSYCCHGKLFFYSRRTTSRPSEIMYVISLEHNITIIDPMLWNLRELEPISLHDEEILWRRVWFSHRKKCSYGVDWMEWWRSTTSCSDFRRENSRKVVSQTILSWKKITCYFYRINAIVFLITIVILSDNHHALNATSETRINAIFDLIDFEKTSIITKGEFVSIFL